MQVRAVRTRVFKENENVSEFIQAHIKKLPEKSVLVIASKIIALAEGRLVDSISGKGLRKEIRKETRGENEFAVPTKYAWFTIKDGMVMANAGIDESNSYGKITLLPKDSFVSAAELCRSLKAAYAVKDLGVIISDSALSPLRSGVTAHALGFSGIKAVRDYRRQKDIFGRKMKMSQTNVVDSLATSAALVMGEGAEQQPLAIIAEAPVVFTTRSDKKAVTIPSRDDIYWPLLKNLKKGN